MEKNQIKQKIESFLLSNGGKRWEISEKHIVMPNGHKFCVDCSGDVFAIFHRDSVWGAKKNFFEWNSCPDLEQKAFSFINSKIQ